MVNSFHSISKELKERLISYAYYAWDDLAGDVDKRAYMLEKMGSEIKGKIPPEIVKMIDVVLSDFSAGKVGDWERVNLKYLGDPRPIPVSSGPWVALAPKQIEEDLQIIFNKLRQGP